MRCVLVDDLEHRYANHTMEGFALARSALLNVALGRSCKPRPLLHPRRVPRRSNEDWILFAQKVCLPNKPSSSCCTVHSIPPYKDAGR